jgi:cytochrome c oxidase cbb3-type subunit 3
MPDHEFDGIRELDNPPPGWIMWMLYASIVFAVGYWLYYQTFAVGRQPTKIYEVEMASAAEAQLARMATQELSDTTLALMAAVPAQVEEGRAIFEQFCVVCHGAAGEGNVGPNLTDRYWLHGGTPMSIWKTLTNGVTDKGMAAWAGQLGPARVQKVVAYVLTLKDTDRPGKAPQGEPEGASPAAPAAPGADRTGT